MNLADEMARIFDSHLMQCDMIPVVGIINGHRAVSEVSHGALECSVVSFGNALAPLAGLRVITSAHLPVGEAAILGDAGVMVVGVRPLSRMDRLCAEARNEARAIVRRNLAEEITWLGIAVTDEPTTPDEAVAFWTGRDRERTAA